MTNTTQARQAAADLVYAAYDFLDARVEGEFEWKPEANGRGLQRTVFLAPVEAEDGVEMVTFHVRFTDAVPTDIEEVFCVTSTDNRYGRAGTEDAIRAVQLRNLGELTALSQRMGLYD